MSSQPDAWKSEGLPKPGTTVVARYRLDDAIARGGMSMIYRAHDLFADRDVALKILPQKLRTARSHARFMREARLASLVKHPHVVVTHDAGLMEDGTPYIVMELLTGSSLYQQLAEQGPLSLGEAARILREVCDGVQAAHERGVIHRDLKPSNVLLVENGSVKVIDFGLSKDIHDTGPSITGPAEALGTPAYMSPEQVLAEPADPRTDVWGAGVLLYELLSGLEAFPMAHVPPGPRRDAMVQQVFHAILRLDPTPITERVPELPPEVDAVLGRALAKRPEDRFQTMDELRHALAPLGLGGRGVSG